jgi:hypothetical protein
MEYSCHRWEGLRLNIRKRSMCSEISLSWIEREGRKEKKNKCIYAA